MLYRRPSIRLSTGLAFSHFPLETRETLYPLIYVLPIPFYELRYLFPVSSIYFLDTGNQNTALFSSFHLYYENFFHLSQKWVTFQYLFITEKPQQPPPNFIASSSTRNHKHTFIFFYVPPSFALWTHA
jgi:hypothetical protein